MIGTRRARFGRVAARPLTPGTHCAIDSGSPLRWRSDTPTCIPPTCATCRQRNTVPRRTIHPIQPGRLALCRRCVNSFAKWQTFNLSPEERNTPQASVAWLCYLLANPRARRRLFSHHTTPDPPA